MSYGVIQTAVLNGLRARSYHKVWKVARTIANMKESSDICTRHLGEAMSYYVSLPDFGGDRVD